MASAAFDLEEFAGRHLKKLDELEEQHLDWTLGKEMDEETPIDSKPNILSPFLPSQVATMNILLEFIPELDQNDVIIDVGCGDGRVLVGASQRRGCRGIGVDVSPDCIQVAVEMVKSEDLAVESQFGLLGCRLKWICDDCTRNTSLLKELVEQDKSRHIYIYLYIYPTLLTVVRPQIEELSRTVCEGVSKVTVITAGYHFEGWPSGYESVVAPRDEGGGPNSSPVELRKLSPHPLPPITITAV